MKLYPQKSFSNRISVVFMTLTVIILTAFYIISTLLLNVSLSTKSIIAVSLPAECFNPSTNTVSDSPTCSTFSDEPTMQQINHDIILRNIYIGGGTILIFALLVFIITKLLTSRLIAPLITQVDQIIKLKHRGIYQELEPLAKEYENLVAKQNQILQEQNDFANYTSHEFRTFLTLLSTKSQILGQQQPQRAVQEIQKDIANFKPVLTELLDYAHLNEMSKDQIVVDLASIVARVCDQYSVQDQRIIFQFTESGSYNILGNEVLLERAVSNLINNGLRHATDHTIKINLTNTFSNTIYLTIQNNGKVIPKKNINLIWQPFFTKHDDGIGLGLSFVKKVIDQCQGTIRVTSENQQTTFHIEFINKGDLSCDY